MVPLVSDKYKYILFYNPKSACSVMRQLFLKLHRNELNLEQQQTIKSLEDKNQDGWHNIAEYFPYRLGTDYSDYFKFTIVRHPLTRITSCYLNQIVTYKSDLDVIDKFINKQYSGTVQANYSFNQFVDYLVHTPFAEMHNSHYLPQSQLFGLPDDYLVVNEQGAGLLSKLKCFYDERVLNKALIKLNATCKLENLTTDLQSVYSQILSSSPEKMQEFVAFLHNMPVHNATPKTSDSYPDARSMGLEELHSMGQFPQYEHFLSEDIIDALYDKYQDDFSLFGYSKLLSETVKQFEKDKNDLIEQAIPSGFDWRSYLELNPDLAANGITTSAAALSHWYHHGQYEDRQH